MSQSAPKPVDSSAVERYRRRFSGVVVSGPGEGAGSDAEERLFLLSKATNEAIWDCNLDTRTIWWNEAYERLFGRRGVDDDATADWWIERINPEDRLLTVGHLEACLSSADTHWTAEYRLRRPDGTYAPIRDRTFISRRAD